MAERPERTFIIQRYSGENWPMVMGELPFLVTGPKFKSVVIPGSLAQHLEYRFTQPFVLLLRDLEDIADPLLQREVAAEFLLSEGFLQALWSVTPSTAVEPELRWPVAIAQLAREIPSAWPIARSVIELLSGMPSPEHARSYVSEDGLTLLAMEP
jgi:hypothetical protein